MSTPASGLQVGQTARFKPLGGKTRQMIKVDKIEPLNDRFVKVTGFNVRKSLNDGKLTAYGNRRMHVMRNDSQVELL